MLEHRATKLEKQMKELLDLESSHHPYIPERDRYVGKFLIRETMQICGMCYSVFKSTGRTPIYVYAEGQVKDVARFLEFVELVTEILKVSGMKDFELVWKDGKKEVVSGTDIADACRRAGIGYGALQALDTWDPVKNQ